VQSNPNELGNDQEEEHQDVDDMSGSNTSLELLKNIEGKRRDDGEDGGGFLDRHGELLSPTGFFEQEGSMFDKHILDDLESPASEGKSPKQHNLSEE